MFTVSDSPTVTLTVLNGPAQPRGVMVVVATARLLCYEQRPGFTRLRLNDGTVLEVQEGTDEIDRRIRLAASRTLSAPPAVW